MTQNIVLLPIDGERDHLSRMNVLGELMTYTRLPIGLGAVVLIVNDRWPAATILVAMFVVLDIADGRFARSGGKQDSARRRGADALIDKLSAHYCALAVCFQLPSALWLWLPMLIRDIIQARTSATLIRRSRIVAAGAPWHRFYSLSLAAWGCAVLLTRAPRIELGLVAWVLGYLSLVDYVSQVRQVQPLSERLLAS